MDRTGDYIFAAHELYSRNATSIGGEKSSRPPIYKVIGIILAISSGLFIGVSFVLKKHGLLKANVKYNEEAGEGYGYLKNAWWWTGMTLMIIGEICNFVAYAFVDAILVTPMGALSVVVTAILSAIFLKERLSFVGKVGCFNCIIGSVVIVINAPEQSAVATIQDMQHLVITPGFLSYAGVVIVGSAITAWFVAPKYGKKTMMVYLSICSMIGGLSVVATQGLGAAIVAQIGGTKQFNQWFLYVLFVFVITTLVTEIIYLNKALNLFNAALVTPTYYVFFTSATIVTSAILFQGFKGTAATISTVIMGFLQICAGVVLLQLSKSSKDVPDAAVFSGDLDQVRTVAEQEEPEYEPRADTIRGGGAILRSLSMARQEKQAIEAKRLAEERMQPIGENEQVEWDGLRRRKTVLESSPSPTVVRRKTIHPPLGMSHFPNEDADHSDNDSDIHPGFFHRLRSHGRGSATHSALSPVGLEPLKSPPPSQDEHIYGLPGGLRRDHVDGTAGHLDEDTAYKPHEPAIHWSQSVDNREAETRSQSGGSLAPPKPPPHTAKRQFSFQNVFHRVRPSSATSEGPASPSRPRSSRKSSRENNGLGRATEEERLGLVKGDSQNLLSVPPPEYSDNSDDDWQMASRQTSPADVLSVPGSERGSGSGGSARGQPAQSVGGLPTFAFEPRRRQNTESELDTPVSERDGFEKDFEKGGGSGGRGGAGGAGAFL